MMNKWIEILLKGTFGLIIGTAAVLTTIILSPFILFMAATKIWNKYTVDSETPVKKKELPDTSFQDL